MFPPRTETLPGGRDPPWRPRMFANGPLVVAEEDRGRTFGDGGRWTLHVGRGLHRVHNSLLVVFGWPHGMMVLGSQALLGGWMDPSMQPSFVAPS